MFIRGAALYFFLAILAMHCSPVPSRLDVAQEIACEEKLVDLLTEATIGMRFQTSSGLDHAQGALMLAQELKPRDPRVLDGLGCLAWYRGEKMTAEKFFRQAIEENPQYDRGYAHLALLAEERGDIPAARDLLRLALGLNPMNFRARNNYAILLFERFPGQQSEIEAYAELLKAYSAAGKDALIVDNLRVLRR